MTGRPSGHSEEALQKRARSDSSDQAFNRCMRINAKAIASGVVEIAPFAKMIGPEALR